MRQCDLTIDFSLASLIAEGGSNSQPNYSSRNTSCFQHSMDIWKHCIRTKSDWLVWLLKVQPWPGLFKTVCTYLFAITSLRVNPRWPCNHFQQRQKEHFSWWDYCGRCWKDIDAIGVKQTFIWMPGLLSLVQTPIFWLYENGYLAENSSAIAKLGISKSFLGGFFLSTSGRGWASIKKGEAAEKVEQQWQQDSRKADRGTARTLSCKSRSDCMDRTRGLVVKCSTCSNGNNSGWEYQKTPPEQQQLERGQSDKRGLNF